MSAKETGEEDTQIHIPKKEYDALVAERDQLKGNLYVLLTSGKEHGYQGADHEMSWSRMCNDALSRITLTPEQKAMIQRQIQQ
jgi:hypothetical protein